MNLGAGLPFEAKVPINALHIVGVGPECVEAIIGTHCDISVVANKATAEKVARVDRMSRDGIDHAAGHIGHDIIKPSIVDVEPQRLAVVAAKTR